MNSNIGIFFNSPYLGGAERSVILQMDLLDNADVTYYIPTLTEGDTKSLKEYLLENKIKKIIEFKYPKSLFIVSRGVFRILDFLSLLYIIKIFLTFRKLKIEEHDIIWTNGNKIGLVTFLYAKIKGFKKSFFWHFRDYPVTSLIYRYMWKVFSFKRNFKLKFIANSDSVKNELLKVFGKDIEIKRIYNPSGLSIDRIHEENKKLFTIGVVSMMAPWKGIHQVITMSGMFHKELSELGVEKINIYGADIYKTSTDHSGYYNSIRELSKKLKADLINFAGPKDPKDIYNHIDLLIHPSMKPEPFGRSISEAFSAGVPVISTALGGSSELIEDRVTGIKIIDYDYPGIYQAIKELIENEKLRDEIRAGALSRLSYIESEIKQDLNSLI